MDVPLPQKRVAHLPWMRNPLDIDQFEQRPLHGVSCLDPRLKEALGKMQIESLFPVQLAVWLETVGPGGFERDICVNSPTGSGKTLAYALPIVQSLSTRKIRCLRALVVLPTRDLALQVKEVFEAIAPAVGLTVGSAVGQSSIADEISALIKRPRSERYSSLDPEYEAQIEPETSVDILVATPGRLMDHITMTKGFSLEHLRFLVVDETDRLLREAYQSWLPTVLQLTSSTNQDLFSCGSSTISMPHSLTTIRRTGVERGFKGRCYPRLMKIILSATLTQDPSKLSQLELHHPILLTSGMKRYRLPEKLKSFKLICKLKLKPLCLVALLEELKGQKCIVFTSSVESTHRLSTLLSFFGDVPFKFSEYSRLQRQSVRSKTLKAFREGAIQVLIATDAMTRGMDVEGITNVINYDMPSYVKTYIHRAGRTARAGLSGSCFTLLRKHEVKRFDSMLQKAENNMCTLRTVPSQIINGLLPVYSIALEKLKEKVESEAARRKYGGGFKFTAKSSSRKEVTCT
ncbi:ATP-dependent RNA helicase dbp6 [Rhynchospora pubera]|uniref:ATP-dependent RNA helicase n=1 Tax=Rhynchospora pubera TaxID=906938 RepID=A0AAV8EWT4_9POAL|nr:ATP-dependent RNA helicase dbp6 [Rhynchospora pubera]